ncbi:MAG: CPBP family intramembrane metalloprotease [Clostridia bacterium]|nr:CPBP family intramembrane metalloprotease [Clostridia bacterium]
MNNYVFLSNGQFIEAEKKRRFMSAQARVTVPLFMMFGISTGCSVLLFIASALFPDMMTNTVGIEITEAAMYLAYLSIPVFTFGLISGKRITSYFTVRRGGRHKVAMFFTGLGIIYFGQYVAVIVSDLLSGAGVDTSSGAYTERDIGLMIFRFVYISVFPAILEELLTRGIVLGELLPYGKGFAVVVSGAVFALMHMNLVQFPFTFLAGVAMAYAALYCGSLRVSMLLHFTNNFLSVLFMYLPTFISDEWSIFIEATVSAAIFICGIAGAIYLMVNKDKDDIERKARCVNVCETDKVDMRTSPLKNVSPLLYVFAVLSVIMAIIEAVLSSL